MMLLKDSQIPPFPNELNPLPTGKSKEEFDDAQKTYID